MSTKDAAQWVASSLCSWVVALSALAWLVAPGTARAFRAPDASMAPAPDYDIRSALPRALPPTAAPGPSTPAQANALSSLQSAVPDLTVRWSALTGAPSRIYSTAGPLTGPSSASAIDVATQFLASNLALFHLSPQDVSELVVSRHLVSQHNGVTHLTFQQQVNGIKVFGGGIEINIDRDGRVLNVSGESIPDIHDSVNTQIPALSANEAQSLAAASAGVTQVRDARSDGLVYVPVALGNTRLAWDVTVADVRTPNVYRTLVDAVDRTVLWRENQTKYSHIHTHGAVFDSDSPIPDSPIGTAHVRRRVERFFHGGGQVFPAILGTPLFRHDDVHFDWWAGAPRTTTVSNNVSAQEDRNGDDMDGIRPTTATDDFTFALDLTQDPSTYTQAAIVNLFYWNNRLHDIWYRYGFDEAAGNFQTNNFGLGGVGGDPVQADAQDQAGNPPTPFNRCNANMTLTPDGISSRMQMFQCNSDTPERDGDFDNPVIIHEFHHGLAERLRPTLHLGVQGGGMGEGAGDFQALAVVAQPGDDPEGRYGIGQYLFNNPAGIRNEPYSIDQTVFTRTFADIGRCCGSISTPCAVDADCPATCGDPFRPRWCAEPHDVGEVWANTLWIARSLLVGRYGFTLGTNAVLQLQIDGYKFAPMNPDFLDLRDAILQADRVNNLGFNQCLLWQAFARMGMGVSATTTGQNDTTPVEAFDVPPQCRS